jgi:hypothetical protein
MPASQGFQWRGSERLRVDIFDAGRLFEIASHEERYEIGNSDLNRNERRSGKTAANERLFHGGGADAAWVGDLGLKGGSKRSRLIPHHRRAKPANKSVFDVRRHVISPADGISDPFNGANSTLAGKRLHENG